MPPLEKQWQVAAGLTPEADENLRDFPPIMRQILFNRGFGTRQAAQDFLRALPPQGSGPDDLLDLPEAVARLLHAIEQGEQIVVYGDYDTDGVTATALLVQTLEVLGAKVSGYIPNRFDEGYGLNNAALQNIHDQGGRLVLTVDCGIRSLTEAAYAASLGLDLIITDHHTPGPELPSALALINPKRPGDPYPEKNLAGVGLAYKLACALVAQAQRDDLDMRALLDLVATGTVADLVPLVGENRSLVRQGLAEMRKPRRQGLSALMGVAGVKAHRVSASDIGFILGPRLNAAGRLDSAMDAYRLLLTADVFEAGRLAQKLDNQNRERQKITSEMQAQAEELAHAEDPAALLLFAAHEDFNPGVVGLTASRLVEQYHRPAVVAQQGPERTRASCRSIPEFHITKALEQCADLLEQFGGHAAAAGFNVRNDNVAALVDRLSALAQEQLGDKDLRPVLQADAEIPLDDLHPSLLPHLDTLQPTGYGNPDARFISRAVKVQRRQAVGQDSAHLKMTVTGGRASYDAIAFRQGHWVLDMPPYVDLLYAFEVNEFRGKQSLQLNVKDLKPADRPAAP